MDTTHGSTDVYGVVSNLPMQMINLEHPRLNDDDRRLLNLLLWLQVAHGQQLERFYKLPCYTIESWLITMRDHGFVAGDIGHGWWLTDLGRARVAAELRLNEVPMLPAPARRPALLRITEIVARVMEAAQPQTLHEFSVRPWLIIAEHDPASPRMDAMIWLKMRQLPAPGSVAGDDDQPDSTQVWRLALEAITEATPPAVLDMKVRAYQAAGAARWLPLIVAPSEEIAVQANTRWADVWPDGIWIATSDRMLLEPSWIVYGQGIVQSWQPFQPILVLEE